MRWYDNVEESYFYLFIYIYETNKKKIKFYSHAWTQMSLMYKRITVHLGLEHIKIYTKESTVYIILFEL